MDNKKVPKSSFTYNCEYCNYNTVRKSQYERHIITAKHIMITNGNNKVQKSSNSYTCCNCFKEFKHRSGLSRHKQKCNKILECKSKDIDIDTQTSDVVVLKNTIMELVKQNNEFKQLLIEQNQTLIEIAKKDTTTTNNNNNTINNNQKFNLNFFLNNTCKDAMNMSEFIENIEVQFKDIENIGKNGYVNGMTEMILSRIKNMDIVKRPLHCTDLKRETMYIKDNNEWEKDSPDNKKLQNMISMIAKRNYATIPLWRNEHPESEDVNNPMYNFNIDILKNVLGDVGDSQIKLDKKIIKNLSKHIAIDKSQ
jgi:hypothetical protein